MREEPDRRRRVRIGQGASGRSTSEPTVLVAVGSQRQTLATTLRVRGRDAGPRGDVSPRCRAERAQVGPDQVREALGLRRVGRADPVIRERETVRPAPLPGARWRDAHEVDPQSEIADESGTDSPSSLTERGPPRALRGSDPRPPPSRPPLPRPASAAPTADARGGRRGRSASTRVATRCGSSPASTTPG